MDELVEAQRRHMAKLEALLAPDSTGSWVCLTLGPTLLCTLTSGFSFLPTEDSDVIFTLIPG